MNSVADGYCNHLVPGAWLAIGPRLRDQVVCRGLGEGQLNRKYREKAVCCGFDRDLFRPSSH